jgi:hypothetical protein
VSVDAGDLTRTSVAELLKAIYECPADIECGPCRRRISELAVRANDTGAAHQREMKLEWKRKYDRLEIEADVILQGREAAEKGRDEWQELATRLAEEAGVDAEAMLEQARISKDAGSDTTTERKTVAGIDPPAPQNSEEWTYNHTWPESYLNKLSPARQMPEEDRDHCD